MGSQKDQRAIEKSSITAFFAGRSIFITGGTGFMGKVLIEKLMRSCPDIQEIFLLMRPKKGVQIDDRLRKMLSLPVFDRVRKERPESLAKLIPVQGDVSMEDLGLPPVERRVLIDRVSVIFHAAANVRFDEDLKKDIISNTRSTRDVCILAGSMKKLVALVHVSSTYAHADKPIVDERAYPSLANWKHMIKIVESMDEQTVRIFAKKLTDPMPNTYTFSKRMAEQVTADYSKDLPCVIYRPSIVISSIEEPVSGWVDNFNGPVGLMVGGGKGILRVMYMTNDISQDYVPVDVAIKAMIVACWKRGIETITKDPTLHVYNCASSEVQRTPMSKLIRLAIRLNEKVPIEGVLMKPRLIITGSRIIHYVLLFLLHLFPAIIVDGILRLTGNKPLLFKLHKKIYGAGTQLNHFLQNEWVFKNDKFLNLMMDMIPTAERSIFAYDLNSFNMEDYFTKAVIGVKTYLLHEDVTDTEQARKHYNRMWWADRIFNIGLSMIAIWLIHKYDVITRVLRIMATLAGI